MGNTPNIRFKGFTDDWEQRKVSDVAKIIAGGTPSTKENSYWEPKEIPWLSSGEVHKKYITFTDDMISQIGMNNSSAKMVAKDSVLIALAGQGKTRGTVAINRIPLTTNQSIAAMTFNENFIPEFVFYNLENRYDELRRMSSGDGSRGGLNKQLVGDIEIPYTEKKEQERIGSFFESLDRIIALHQRKCDETKKLKKFMLQKMFPKKDAKKPEIRFAGFTDDWEQRKLGDDLVSIHTGTNLLGSITNTGMPLIKMGNIQRGYFDTLKVEFLAENEQPDKADIANYGDFFFNTRNTLELVGKGATWMKNSGEYAFNSNIARFELRNLDTIFFNYLYNTDYMTKQIHARAMGTTSVAAIYPRTLDSVEYSAPCMKEQQKIGAYFKQLDHLITLHQRKCDELKEFKKYMLQNMFPQKG